VTIDKSGANLAGLEAINAERETPIRIRQNKYLNNISRPNGRFDGIGQSQIRGDGMLGEFYWLWVCASI
jgi:hypothetical protein